MTPPLYPIRVNEIESWAKVHGVTRDEGRKRFVQFVVLESIAGSVSIRDKLAFKGGNALRFVHGNPRSTLDLDFTALTDFPDDEAAVRTILDAALVAGGRRFGFKLKCQRVKRNPARKDATLPTYSIGVGYQFPGDRHFADFEQPHRMANAVVELEVSLNDIVCETERHRLSPDEPGELQVCSLEDIIAEKLRALLQQIPRNRTRPQDVFDIASRVTALGDALNLQKVTDYLLRKSAPRDITATKAAFADPEVKRRAATDYETSLQLTQTTLPPFENAWATVLELVSKLGIPE
jgi:predicted nucleotidyltransferase component of viral defense system